MADQRLPTVNSDDEVWGDELNLFLAKEHYNNTGVNDAANGGHKTITIRAGTATAGTEPLKFTSGVLLTTPEAGAVEFVTDKLYYTQTTSTIRRTIASYAEGSGATGDIYYRDASGIFTALSVGTGNQVLGVTSGLPAWKQATFATVTKSNTTYTIATSDTVVLGDCTLGAVTLTLPSASSASGYRFFVKKIDSTATAVTINRAGSDTIDGSTSVTITVQYVSITMVSNGSNWYIV